MWFQFFLWVFSLVLSELTRPKPRDTSKPASLGEFSAPTSSEGRSVQLWWGTVQNQAPNVLWYGDLKTKKITKRVKSGMFSHDNITIGYRYYIGMQFGLGEGEMTGPKDGVRRVWVDDKLVFEASSPEAVKDGYLIVNKPTLYGDEKGPGGVVLKIRVYPGTQTQAQNAYLQSQLGTDIPAYRGTVHAVIENTTKIDLVPGNSMFAAFLRESVSWYGYVGNAPNLRKISFEQTRIPNGLGLSTANAYIGPDFRHANLLNVAYEIMTRYCGIPTSMIDTVTFTAAALTTAAELNGFSLILDSGREAKDILSLVEQQMDGVLYFDPGAAQYKCKLIRASDVSPISALPSIDESDIVEIASYSRGLWQETSNEVRIAYADPDKDYATTFALAQDMANFQIQEGAVSVAQDYPGVKDKNLANKLAWRDLRTLSYPTSKLSGMKVKRVAYDWIPGTAFMLASWEPLEIVNKVYRVIRINYGEVGDNVMLIDAVEDIFVGAVETFGAPPISEWVPPVFDAIALTSDDFRIWEIPRALLPEDVVEDSGPVLAVLVKEPNGLHLGYEVWWKTGTTSNDQNLFTQGNIVEEFTPRGLLTAALLNTGPYTGGTFTVGTTTGVDGIVDGTLADLDISPFNLALVDDEVVFFETKTDNGNGTYTFTNVRRGMLNTVPATHAIGAKVWFFTYGAGLVKDEPFAVADTVHYRLLTKTGSSLLAWAATSTFSHTVTGVGETSYPPNDVKVNTARIYDIVTTVGQLAVTWKGRNTTQALKVDQDDAHIVPDNRTGYNMRLYRRDVSPYQLLRTLNGIPTTSTGGVYNASGFAVDATRDYRFEIWAVNNSVASQAWAHDFTIKGYGYDYGGTDTESPALIGYGGSLTAGAITARGAAPPVIEPLPGLDVQNTVSIAFTGTFPGPITIVGFMNGQFVGTVGNVVGATQMVESPNGDAPWTVTTITNEKLGGLIFGDDNRYHAIGGSHIYRSPSNNIHTGGAWTDVTVAGAGAGGAWTFIKYLNGNLYAVYSSSFDNWVIKRSVDHGLNWTTMAGTSPQGMPADFHINNIFYDGTNTRYLVFGTYWETVSPGVKEGRPRVYESADLNTFTLLADLAPTPATDNWTLNCVVQQGAEFLCGFTDNVGTPARIAHSADRGDTWTHPVVTFPTSNPPSGVLSAVWGSPQYTVAGRDWAARSTTGTSSWTSVSNIFGFGETLSPLISTSGGSIQMANLNTATTFRAARTLDHGATWTGAGIKSDIFTVTVTLFPFAGGAQQEIYTLNATGVSTLEQLASQLAVLVQADYGDDISTSVSGGTVVLTTSVGTLDATLYSDTATTYYTVNQEHSGVTAGTQHITTYDFYEKVADPLNPGSTIEDVSAQSSTKYNSGGTFIIYVEVYGLTYETRKALGISGSIRRAVIFHNGSATGVSGQYTLPLDGFGGLEPNTLDLHRALELSDWLRPYVQTVQMNQVQTPFATWAAPRAGVQLIMQPNYAIVENSYDTTESNVPAGMQPYKVLNKTNRRGVASYPSGARRNVEVVFTTTYNQSGPVQFVQEGQIFAVTLNGIRYQTIATAADAAAAASIVYKRDDIYARLKTAIEAGPYTVTLKTFNLSGGGTVVGSMEIEHDNINTNFSVVLSASFGIEATITRS